MASANVAVAPRPKLLVANRSRRSDSSNTQESGTSSAFESALEHNLETGYHPVTTVAISTPLVVPTPVQQYRKAVAFEHRQGRQALDLTRDKPLPSIPASPTTPPVRRCCLYLSALLADTLSTHSPPSFKRPLRPCPGSSHSEVLSNPYDGDVQTGQNISIQPISPNAGSPGPHLLPITTSPRTPNNHNPIR